MTLSAPRTCPMTRRGEGASFEAKLASFELRLSAIEAKLNLLQWMVGFNLIMTVAIVIRLFTLAGEHVAR